MRSEHLMMIKGIQALHSPEYQKKLSQCIHCGLCLQACPTYQLFGTEMDSPRGRIALMRAASLGRIETVEFQLVFRTHIDLCLACRSCESACPSGVKYGELVEAARIVVESNRKVGWFEKFIRIAGTRHVMPHRGRLRLMAQLLKIYQASGLQKLIRSKRILPGALASMESLIPPRIESANNFSKPVSAIGTQRGRVLFFYGCIQEGFLPGVNRATLNVLQRNGYEVLTPGAQTCCGAAQLHLGDIEQARQLARRNIDAFLQGGERVTAILSNAGGCGLALKEYAHLLAEDPLYRDKAHLFARKVYDINEFLADGLHVRPRGAIPVRATYVDSCHLRHGQKVARAPRQLLDSIPGLEVVELQFPDQCCGSAGVYNILHPEPAAQILDAKMADILATQAKLVITSNTGCHLQLLAGARKAGLNAQVMHVVEVLELSYQTGDNLPEGFN